jgi:glycosyltransferase involved in cell wall biosynthesis
MKINVLIFGHGYKGGFLEANNQYVKIFDPDKYEVSVVYLKGEPNDAIRNKHLTPHVYFLNTTDAKGLKLHAIRAMYKLQREKKFQIVVCHRYKPSFVMAILAKLFAFKALFFVMSEMGVFSQWRRKFLFNLLSKKNITLAGVSNAVRDNIREDVRGIPPARIITLYNMVDCERLESQFMSRKDARLALNLTPTDFVFGNLARLAEAKDHATLIKAFSLAKPLCQNAKLVLIGDGVLKNQLISQIKDLQLEDAVILTGFLQKALPLLKAFDVFALTSIKEAFGLVLLEAMLAKVPIIATNVGGISEVLGNTGTLIPAKNPEELAKQMVKHYHLAAEELETLGETGYLRATNEFSNKRFKEIFFNLPIIKENQFT